MAIIFTNAPENYDGFGSRTIEIVGTISGKPIRRVKVRAEHRNWQMARYQSGMNLVSDNLTNIKPLFDSQEAPNG